MNSWFAVNDKSKESFYPAPNSVMQKQFSQIYFNVEIE